MERAFERLQKLNAVKFEQAEAEAKPETAGGSGILTFSPTVKKQGVLRSSQESEIERTGP